MISGYYEFLLETILLTSQNFEDIIKDIDDDVSSDLLSLINKDIKTQYNALDITNSGDNISFMSDSQFNTKIKSGINPLDLFLDTNNKSSSGRIIRKILKDNGKEYSDVQISEFVDRFKASYQKYKSKSEKKDPIRLVSGEELRFWYLCDNYCDKTRRSYGTLGKSCMSYNRCQSYLDIYVKNPDVCKLLILTNIIDGVEKLLARALIWTTDVGYLLDRVYYTDSSEANILSNWAKENLNCEFFHNTSKHLTVQLRKDTIIYDEFPYMDTMVYYYTIDRKLYNYEPKVDNKKELLYCQDTEGGYERQDMVICEFLDESHPSDEVVYSEYHNSYLPKDRTEWSDYHNSYLYTNEAVFSKAFNDYLGKDDSVEVVIDNVGNEDWLPDSSDIIDFDRVDDKYYLKKLMINIGDEWYYKDNVIKYVIVNGDSIVKYKEIFNIDEDIPNIDCVISEICASFYNLSNNISDDGEWMIKSSYYKKVYMYVNYQKMYDELELIKGADDVIEELEQANSTLLKDDKNAYKHRNWVYDIGVDKLISFYKNSLDNKSVRENESRFDVAFYYALNSYGKLHIDESKLKKETRKIVENDLFEFCSGCKDIGYKYVKCEMNKLSKFVNIFKKEFPTYDIEILLRVVANTIFLTTHSLGSYLGRIHKNILDTILYFINNPNKLPNK